MLGRGHKRKHLDSFNVLDIFIVRNYQTGHKVDLSLSLTFPSHKQVTKSDFRQFVNNTKVIGYLILIHSWFPHSSKVSIMKDEGKQV